MSSAWCYIYSQLTHNMSCNDCEMSFVNDPMLHKHQHEKLDQEQPITMSRSNYEHLEGAGVNDGNEVPRTHTHTHPPVYSEVL